MKNAFVIGHPIAHSKSPLVHGHWLRSNEIDGNYTSIDVAPDRLNEFASNIRNGSHIGGNVTVPHKEAIMPLCDHITETAKKNRRSQHVVGPRWQALWRQYRQIWISGQS